MTWILRSQSSCHVRQDWLSLNHRAPPPPGSNLPWRRKVYRLVPDSVFLEKCRRGIFVFTRHVWATALRLDPPQKGLVPCSSDRWNERQIPFPCAYVWARPKNIPCHGDQGYFCCLCWTTPNLFFWFI